MDRGRRGETGKVTRSPWKYLYVRVFVCMKVYDTAMIEAKL